MKFCVISPVGGLEKYATWSNMHLVLPQVRYKEYIQFYKKMKERGDTIILDNGAYEGSFITPARWEQRLYTYEPDVVVCPDKLLEQWSITLDLTKDFLDRWYVLNNTFNFQFMGVPQSLPGDISGWYTCCRKMLEDERITWIGLPRALFTHYGRHEDLRATIACVIKDIRPDIKLHALGMADGSLMELRNLRNAGVIESIDSSAPVWRGHCGYDIEDVLMWEKFGTRVDFKPRPIGHEQLIERNLRKVFESCRSTQNGMQNCSTSVVG